MRSCRSLDQFWSFIKGKSDRYAGRREFIWAGFRPLLEQLERGGAHPSDASVGGALEVLDSAYVQEVWSKALERRQTDPEGAITAARTLLEAICKQILDRCDVEYTDREDLPKLYRLVAKELNLAPSQHTEETFRKILGGCTAVVGELGSLRNRLSDAHGRGGPAPVRPAPRHAELAVNLAGSMAQFLVATWAERHRA
ncbi:MAG: abortive infection family protein [Myxococcales bacterium]|nr:abortive infection family protein [Myxococcales bacterium]